ncbi:hypothetical protein [Chryseobacterium sp. 5_R23647]|uniref:hypothetical protein n=1 Tax=Chryseobacterium sp. 5_R23647 TaxID=2258964 RepID=UPI000E22BEBC|nr:hypothetical protein [Chryseobacterium sp. 5_R23647]REC40511.1 hypothetical protein DRF69_18630 [Chryseobacterium sp. 5_R23647]
MKIITLIIEHIKIRIKLFFSKNTQRRLRKKVSSKEAELLLSIEKQHGKDKAIFIFKELKENFIDKE